MTEQEQKDESAWHIIEHMTPDTQVAVRYAIEQAKIEERKRIIKLIRDEYTNLEYEELGSFEFTEDIVSLIESKSKVSRHYHEFNIGPKVQSSACSCGMKTTNPYYKKELPQHYEDLGDKK
jgi:NhaP-type Na+/H+ and K+/H+ antiporter